MHIGAHPPKKIVNREAATRIGRVTASSDEMQTPVSASQNRNSQTHRLPDSHAASHLEHTGTYTASNVKGKDEHAEPTRQESSTIYLIHQRRMNLQTYEHSKTRSAARPMSINGPTGITVGNQ
ncbi:hypothetical protein LIER_24308 [Lithospermum erythrorhizon]|uniref:Uncharacterized protein n=1 Tax=Lithospermum erythrorhizon TaxID=34254 RepID=A0AAV3R0W0_LITER